MAWQRKPTIEAVFWFTDEGGSSVSHIINLPDSVTSIADIEAFCNSYAAACAALSDSKVDRYTVSVQHYQPIGQAAAAQVGSDIKRHGTFIVETSVSGERAVVSIPSIDEMKLETAGTWAGINIDQADSDVTAYLSILLTGSGGIAPVAPWGNDLVTLLAAYKQYRI